MVSEHKQKSNFKILISKFKIKNSGTTWMQELVWMVVNNCDFEKGKSAQLSLRSPFLEYEFNA